MSLATPIQSRESLPAPYLWLRSVNIIAHETSLLGNLTGISISSCPTRNLPPSLRLLSPPQVPLALLFVNFSNYYPVVKLSNLKVILNFLIPSVNNPFQLHLLNLTQS